MAPRRQKKPTVAPYFQTIDFSATEDAIQCKIPIDPQLLESQPESHFESHPESRPSQPTTPPQPSTEDQLDRIEWTTEMIHVLFTELLDQAQDGKRADSGFKKEAWDSVLREVRAVYIGPLTITLQKVKQKEQTFKGYYKDWKFLRAQSGFGWDEEMQMITASDRAWDDIIAVRYYPFILLLF
jgi:hypothetical protein